MSLVGRLALGEGKNREQDISRNKKPPISYGVCGFQSASTAIISSYASTAIISSYADAVRQV